MGKNIKPKGTSRIPLIIILLLVAISMGATFFIWSQQNIEVLEGGVRQEIVHTTSNLIQEVRVEGAFNDTVIVRSIGAGNIDTDELEVYVDGVLINCGWDTGVLFPGETSSCSGMCLP